MSFDRRPPEVEGSGHDHGRSAAPGHAATTAGGSSPGFAPLGLGGHGAAASLARGSARWGNLTDADVDGIGDEDDADEGGEGPTADDAAAAEAEAADGAADAAGGEGGGEGGEGAATAGADAGGAEGGGDEAAAAAAADAAPELDGVGDDEDADTGAGADDSGEDGGGAAALLDAAESVESQAEAEVEGGGEVEAASAEGGEADADGEGEALADADVDLDGDGVGDADNDDAPAPSNTDMQTVRRAQQYDPYIREAAGRYGVREDHLRAIMSQESRAQNGLRAGGAQSASGLMQVTGETWRAMQRAHRELAQYDFGSYWREPRINILFGAATLASKQRRLVDAGVGRNDPHMAQLTVAAYNGGEGIVTDAIRRARAAGSRDPGGDALKAEFLKPAIARYPSVYRYYLTGGGKRRNPSRSVERAIELKFHEISQYPIGVAKYLEAQRRLGISPGAGGSTGGTGGTTAQPQPQARRQPTGASDGGGAQRKARDGGGRHRLRGSVGRRGQNQRDDVSWVQSVLGLRTDGRATAGLVQAIRSFQRAFLRRVDGLIEVGKRTERHLLERGGGAPATEPSRPQPRLRLPSIFRRPPVGEASGARGGGQRTGGPRSGGPRPGSTGSSAGSTAGRQPAGTMPRQQRNSRGQYIVGGYPSSRPAGTKWPMYSGAVVSASIPGLSIRSGVKLTPAVVRAARIVAQYLPRGTVMTSAWRSDEEQAGLIVRFAGGLTGGDLARAFEVARSRKAIGWVGNSNHRPGLAFDLSGAPLRSIEAAVNRARREHAEAGITGTIFESNNNCFHVNVAP